MPRPRAGSCRRRTSSSLRNQRSSRASRTTRKLQVLRKGCHQVVAHRPQSAEVGDIVVAESATREYGIITREQNIFPVSKSAHKLLGAQLTCHINSTMASVSIQVIVREASPSHEPRSFSDNLGIVAIGIAVDSVEHFSVAGTLLASHGVYSGSGILPDNGTDVVSREDTLVSGAELVGDHDPGDLVRS